MLTQPSTRTNIRARLPMAVVLALLFMATFAMGVSFFATRHGVGFEADSMDYVFAARTLVERGQLLNLDLTPFSHWPPLYPVILAALSPAFGDALVVARDLNIVLFPLNLLLLAGLVFRTTYQPAATLISTLIFLLSANILDTHVTAMSEAPALTCWLTGLIFLLEYKRSGAWGFLLGSAFAAAACVLVRYVGIVLVVTGASFVAVYAPGARMRRGLHAIFYFAVAITPLAWWLLSRPASGLTTERHIGFYGLGSEQIYNVAVAVLRWLAPIDEHAALKIALAALLAAGTVVLAVFLYKVKQLPADGSNGQTRVDAAPVWLVAANFIAYELLLLVCGLFLDPRQDIGERMQTIAFVFLLLLMAFVWPNWLSGRLRASGAFANTLAAGLLAVLLGIRLVTAALWIKNADHDHLDYNNAEWRNSPAIDLVKKSYANVPIYSNYPVPLYLYTSRNDLMRIPPAADDIRHQADPEFDRRMADMLAVMAKKNGILVMFNSKDSRFPSIERLEANPRLQVVQVGADATFFRAVSQ